MTNEEYRQFLENCLEQKIEKESKELNQFKHMLDWFLSEISEIASGTHNKKIGYMFQAKKSRDDAIEKIKEEQTQKVKQVSRSAIRISSAVIILVLFHQCIYSPIAYQFCKYNNIASRTYEDKEQCR